MSGAVSRYQFLESFSCLGADCEDTCCKGWGMQLDPERKALYENEAPELLDAVTSGEAELIMKRDPETDYCVKFDKGICAIHKEKGTKFLGDACHFYPRVTRQFGEQSVMAATFSCPEIVRNIMEHEAPFTLQAPEEQRLPYSLQNYLPEGADPDAAINVITSLLEMVGDESITPEHAMAKLVSIATSMESYDPQRWPDGISLFIKTAEGTLPAPEEGHLDFHHILHTLSGLIYASKKTPRPRLDETFATMEKALGITIDKETLDIMQDLGAMNALAQLKERWQKAEAACAPVLRRWLQGQIAMTSFPFAGLGSSPKERAILIAVRFATVRQALMSHVAEDGTPPDSATITRIIQSLSRFMDHLADPELSLNMYEEAGWLREARLRALVGDIVAE